MTTSQKNPRKRTTRNSLAAQLVAAKDDAGEKSLVDIPPPVPAEPGPSSKHKLDDADADADDGPPPCKRTRKTEKPTRRHEEWWLLDGSVVLELHGVLFRLVRSTLSRKSTFFEDLFKEPPADTLDSCPLYVIDRGTVDDFAALLKAMDEGLSS